MLLKRKKLGRKNDLYNMRTMCDTCDTACVSLPCRCIHGPDDKTGAGEAKADGFDPEEATL